MFLEFHSEQDSTLKSRKKLILMEIEPPVGKYATFDFIENRKVLSDSESNSKNNCRLGILKKIKGSKVMAF